MLSHSANNFTKSTEKKQSPPDPYLPTACGNPCRAFLLCRSGPSIQKGSRDTALSAGSPSLCKGRASGALHEVPPEVSTLIRAHGARGSLDSEEQASIEAALLLGAAILWKCPMEEGEKSKPESLFTSETQRSSEMPWSGHTDAALKHGHAVAWRLTAGTELPHPGVSWGVAVAVASEAWLQRMTNCSKTHILTTFTESKTNRKNG